MSISEDKLITKDTYSVRVYQIMPDLSQLILQNEYCVHDTNGYALEIL